MESLDTTIERLDLDKFYSSLRKINTVINTWAWYFAWVRPRKVDFTSSELNEVYDLIKELFWEEKAENYAQMVYSINYFSAENFICQFRVLVKNNFEFNWLVEINPGDSASSEGEYIWSLLSWINRDSYSDESFLIKSTFTRWNFEKYDYMGARGYKDYYKRRLKAIS